MRDSLAAFLLWKQNNPDRYKQFKDEFSQDQLEVLAWRVDNWAAAAFIPVHNGNLAEALSQVVDFEIQVALDPSVSSEARKLLDQGKINAYKEILDPE